MLELDVQKEAASPYGTRASEGVGASPHTPDVRVTGGDVGALGDPDAASSVRTAVMVSKRSAPTADCQASSTDRMAARICRRAVVPRLVGRISLTRRSSGL